jgi:hypothetical protein
VCWVIVPLVFWFALSAPAFENEDTKFIETYISNQARREMGEEYREARKLAAGDLNHDGTPDIAALYTIEGQQVGSSAFMAR